MPCFPTHIYSGPFPTPHCQGIALDQAKGVMYFSYTTMLVKTDLEGNVIGTVDGLTGHLGCIAFSEDTRKVYGSLEYKNDPIGRGIHAHLGLQEDPDNAFFIAIFEGDAIDRIGMDAETDGVMKTVFLRDVWEDFEAPGHRYGCSGIDGTTIAPIPGTTGPRDHLLVAYGIYGDNDRDDNDHQVILSYPLAELESYATPTSGWPCTKAVPKSRKPAILSSPATPSGVCRIWNTTPTPVLCSWRCIRATRKPIPIAPFTWWMPPKSPRWNPCGDFRRKA